MDDPTQHLPPSYLPNVAVLRCSPILSRERLSAANHPDPVDLAAYDLRDRELATIHADDKSFFLENPARRYRLRPPAPCELPAGYKVSPADRWLIRQVRPGQLITLMCHDIGDTGDDEASCLALWAKREAEDPAIRQLVPRALGEWPAPRRRAT